MRTITCITAAITLCIMSPVFAAPPTVSTPAIAATETSWPMFRGNPSLTGVAVSSLPKKLARLWTYKATEAVSSSAAIVNNTVYLGDEDGVFHAIDLGNGKPKWTHKTDAPILSSPLVHGDTVYFGNDDGILFALDAKTGKPRWTYQTGSQIISSPNMHNDRILFGSYDAFLYCLSVRDGSLLWKLETEGRIHGTPGIRASALVSHGNASGGTPSVKSTRVFVAGCDEFLHVANIADGSEIRRVAMDAVSGCSAAVADSRVYVGTYGGEIKCIDHTTGKILWTFRDPDREFPYLASVAITDRAILIGGRDKRFRALNPNTGEEMWQFRTRGRIDSSPVIVGKRIFFGSNDGILYELDLVSGKEIWRYETGAPITASPAIAANRLVIANHDGVVYCFGPPGK